MEVLRFQVFNGALPAVVPSYGTEGSAGLDLYAVVENCNSELMQSYLFGAHQTVVIPTNLKVFIPEGCYGRIAPRSSIAMRGLMVNAGVIDCDYRGEIKIMLHNLYSRDVELDLSRPIAQLIIEKYKKYEVTQMFEATVFIQDAVTVRGSGGFGSTDTTSSPHVIPAQQLEDLAELGYFPPASPLIGIETNPGPQCTTCDHCSSICRLGHDFTLFVAERTSDTRRDFCCLVCLLRWIKFNLPAAQLVGVELNPGPLIHLCDECNNSMCNYLNMVTLFPGNGKPHSNFCKIVCMLRYVKRNVPAAELVGVELNPGPALPLIYQSKWEVFYVFNDGQSWQPWYCASSKAWRTERRRACDRAREYARELTHNMILLGGV